MSHRPLLLSALAAAAALAALPSVAHAAATCAYDPGTRELNLRYGAGDSELTLSSRATLRYAEGGGVLRSCFSSSGVAATAANTDKVVIKAVSGTGALPQTTTIDETAGGLMETNRNLRVFVFTGTNDRLIIKKGSGADRIRLRDQTGLALGPAIDLDYNGIVDLSMTTNDSVVQVDGGIGDDIIDAWAINTYRTVLRGEDGRDTLLGGNRADELDGGADDDHLYAKDGLSESIVGGAGFDDAQVDAGDVMSGVEAPRF